MFLVLGFNLLLDNLPDLVLDTPEAATMLGNFIARAVADDCIPPVYVFGNVDRDSFNKHAQKAIKRAESLLLLKTTMVHLDNVWGSAGPLRPVKNITKRMAALLKEFVDSRDVTEAQHCLRGLEVPHYHHELVYEAIVLALEAVNNTVAEAMCQLLASLDESCLVTPATMEQVSSIQTINSYSIYMYVRNYYQLFILTNFPFFSQLFLNCRASSESTTT